MIETYVCPSCQENIDWDDSNGDEFVECLNCGDKLRAPNAPMFSKGTVIGDYVVEKRLGIGGMGEVYLAEQKSMMRPVALKVLQPDLVEDKSYLERFYREVRTLAQIEHPNIVKAIETGYEDNICYFSMTYIEGNDLKHKLDREGKMSELDALHVILNVAMALQFVWERHKIIHRDIKPANIILTEENEVKLMDLGISKTISENKPADLTIAGMMVGSPYYVSPEQARAEKDIDWRADQYSLGASFYHMLVGSLPFDSENAMTIIAAHLSKPIPDPRIKNPDISDRSANIIGQMMQKDRDDRFVTWDDAIEAIEDAIEEVSEHGKASTTILTSMPKEVKEQLKNNLNQTNRTSTKHAAAPDMVGKLKEVATKTFFGNLYIRFIILVLLLFMAFLAFFRVVKDSIYEAKRNRAKARIEIYNNYKNDMPDTKQARHRAYNLLMDIKKAGIKESSDWADLEIKQLQKQVFSQRKGWEKETIRKELEKLKNETYELNRKGKIDEAIKVWENYEKHGAFAEKLDREIQNELDYLRRQKKRGGGIE